MLTWRLEESANGFEEDGKAEGEEEDAINQSCEYIRSMPAIGISCIYMRLVGKLRMGD